MNNEISTFEKGPEITSCDTSSGNLALISSSVDDSSDEESESDSDNDDANIAVSTGSGGVSTASSKRKVAGLSDSTF